MRVEQHPRSGPPPRIEPAGFFTGTEIRPIVIGVVVDYIATYVAIYAYFFVYLARELAKQGEVTPELLAEYMLSTEGLLVGLVIGASGTALGGFVAGYKASKLETKHGAFVGAGSLIVSFVEQAIQPEPVAVPEWFRVVSLLIIIPAGALGGYAASAVKSMGIRLPGP